MFRPSTPLVSVSAMPMLGALAPARRAICCLSRYIASPTCVYLVRMSAAVVLAGYQWTSTKSILGPAIESTAWFQEPVSPPPSTPSGQLAGIVITAPTLIVGSTAFMASEKATTPLA